MKHRFYILITLAVLIVLIIIAAIFNKVSDDEKSQTVKTCDEQRTELFISHLEDIYNTAGLDTAGLNYSIFKKAMTGYYNLKDLANKPILSIIDFRKPSSEKRKKTLDRRPGKQSAALPQPGSPRKKYRRAGGRIILQCCRI
jgi:hypothetical protein